MKSQPEFYMGPMPNLRIPISLFLNPSRIQIRTQFMWVPVLLPLLGHSSIILDSSLSLSPAITEEGSPLKQKIPIAKTYSIHSSSKKTSSETHSKKKSQIKTYQAQPTRTRQDQKKKKRDLLKKKLKPTAPWGRGRPHWRRNCPCKQEISAS